MKLNNKGFAISSIMYIVMIMCIILILLTLSVLSSRKLILDKQKNNILDNLYDKEKTFEPNEPLLLDGLVPVVYKNNNWVVADTKDKWYDYDNKIWANAVILNDNKLKSVGDIIDIDTEVQGMFVWIPRFEYNIYGSDINVTFIDTSKIKESNGYKIHPAFNFGDKNLSGIWVGKFETTGSGDKLTILPNKISLTTQNVSNSFILSRSININGIDSHMAKNIEWGAIAYLSYSKYGKKIVGVNSCNEYKTGMGNSCLDTYENGFASTTGNITGVYDMNGGRDEYVMAVFNKNIASSGFSGLTDDIYFDNYTSIMNCNGINCFGDALNETNGINTGSKIFINQTNPWLIRDSIFGYLSGDGKSLDKTFRIVLTKS